MKLFNNSESSRELEKNFQIKPLFFGRSAVTTEKKGDEPACRQRQVGEFYQVEGNLRVFKNFKIRTSTKPS